MKSYRARCAPRRVHALAKHNKVNLSHERRTHAATTNDLSSIKTLTKPGDRHHDVTVGLVQRPVHRAAVWPQACMLWWRVVSECLIPALAAIPTETEAAPLMS